MRQLVVSALQETGLRVLEAKSGALRAAQSLEERAHDMLTWPIDEGR